jgi:hypothetical protein
MKVFYFISNPLGPEISSRMEVRSVFIEEKRSKRLFSKEKESGLGAKLPPI